jgi:Zn-dependent protease
MLVSGLLENPSHGVLIVAQAMAVAASINLTLAVFNLLPIPPLDGSKILQSFLPLRWHPYIWRLEANPTYAIVAMLLLLTVFRQPLGSFLGLVRTWFFDAFGL